MVFGTTSIATALFGESTATPLLSLIGLRLLLPRVALGAVLAALLFIDFLMALFTTYEPTFQR